MPGFLVRLRSLKKLPMLLDRIAALVALGKPWNCGGRMRPGSARSRRSPADGPSAAAAPRLRSIRGPSRPSYSAPSAPPRAKPPDWFCRNATPPQCRCIAPKSPRRSHRARTRWSCSTKPAGICPKLKVPDNITLLPLPPKRPEINPTENIWQYMPENWLSNRIFRSYKGIVDHCCQAWNTLASRP